MDPYRWIFDGEGTTISPGKPGHPWLGILQKGEGREVLEIIQEFIGEKGRIYTAPLSDTQKENIVQLARRSLRLVSEAMGQLQRKSEEEPLRMAYQELEPAIQLFKLVISTKSKETYSEACKHVGEAIDHLMRSERSNQHAEILQLLMSVGNWRLVLRKHADVAWFLQNIADELILKKEEAERIIHYERNRLA